MIPTPIPDDEVWAGATRRVIGPPAGMEPWEIPPVEVLSEVRDDGAPLIHVRIALEPDDLRRIQAGQVDHFWLTLWSDHLHAFATNLPRETVIVCDTCRERLIQQPDVDPLGYWFHATGETPVARRDHAPAPIEVFVDELEGGTDGG